MTRVAQWVTRRGGATRCALVAVVLGLMATAAVAVPPWLAWCALAVAVTGLAIGVAGRGVGSAVCWVLVAALCVGLLVGALRVAALTRSTLRPSVGKRCTVEAVVASGLVRTTWGERCLLVVDRVALGSDPALSVEPEAVRLEMSTPEGAVGAAVGAATSDGATPSLVEGSRVVVAGRLVAPPDGADGGFDQRAALRREGVAVILRAGADDVTLVGARGGLAGVFDRLRVAAREHLVLGLSTREAGWLRGVVLGEQDAVDPVTVAALRRSGTAHILSVGGLHLASLAAVMLAGVRLVRGPRLLGYVLGGAAAWLFVPLVGASPPVMRAAVVLAFVLMAEASGRGRDRWQIYAAAGALTLALNPFSLYSLSFQLSFVAAAGLMVLTRPVQRRLSFVPDLLASGVATSVAATVATAPLSLLAFDQVALMGIVANLLVVPVLPAVMAASLGSIVGGFVWHPLAAALNLVSATCMAWVAWVAQLAAQGPVLTSADVAPAMSAIGGGLLAWVAQRRWERRRPAGIYGGNRRRAARPLRVAIIIGGVLAGLVVVQTSGWVSDATAAARGERGWPAQTEVRVLDVGEGSATLIRTADGHAVLVDAGPQGAGLAAQLRGLGVGTLDLVVVTHPHADHYGGLTELSGQVRVAVIADHVRLAATGTEYGRLVADMTRSGARHEVLVDRESLRLADVDVQVRAPPEPLDDADLGGSASGGPGAVGADGATMNAASLVVEVRVGGLAILLPGDAEAEVLEGYAPSPVDVLVVPHHGSRAAVSARLLKRLGIRLAIVPVGPNSFGHPAPQTLATLQAAGVSVLRTDRAGWVALGAGDGRVVWQRPAGGTAEAATVQGQ